jgi:release factor glutamine methyltransferase
MYLFIFNKVNNVNFSRGKDYSIVEIDKELKIDVLDGVYRPAEDSYLLIKAMEVEGKEKALDMGCGTGIVALHLAKYGCDVTAADINEKAIENTKINAEKNGFKIKCVKSNLFSNIKEKFDLIAFNPPYLPTKNEDIAWDGGEGGIKIIKEFLKQARNHLNKNGKIYVVASSLTDIETLKEEFGNIYDFKEVVKEKFFFERLYVYLISPKSG